MGPSFNSFFHRFTSNYWDSGLGFQMRYESSNVTQWTHRMGTCGGSFTTPKGFLTSPSYPDYYPLNADCVYTISRPTGTVIVLTFHSVDIEIHWSGSCIADYLEIRDGSSAASFPISKLCGTEIPAPIQSSQNQVWMKWGKTVYNSMSLTLIDVFTFRFHSNQYYDNANNGFQLEYSTMELFTDCGGNYTNASGILTSPSYPNPYPHLADCTYLLSQPNGTFVNVSFISMDVSCHAAGPDYIEMRDGGSEDSPLMRKLCGDRSNVPNFMQTTQNNLRIRWRRGES